MQKLQVKSLAEVVSIAERLGLMAETVEGRAKGSNRPWLAWLSARCGVQPVALSIAPINRLAKNGFRRYATQPASVAALCVASSSTAVMNIVGGSDPDATS